jgi:hypothetical protein
MSSIPLAALSMRPMPAPENPLEVYARGMSLKNMMQRGQIQGLELQQAQQQMQEQEAVKQAIAEAGGDVRKALPKIMQVSPKTGMVYQEWFTAQDTGDITKQKSIIDLNLTKIKGLGQLAGSITDQATFSAAIDQAEKQKFLEPAEAAQLRSAPYNPETLKAWQTQALTTVEQLGEVKRKLDEQEAGEKLKKTTAEATMAGQEALLTPQERANLRERREVPGIDVPYSEDVEAQRTRIATGRTGDQETIETTAGDYLTEANGDANKALAQLEKDVQAKNVDPRLRRYAARIRFRIRERVRPGVPGGRRDRLAEILGETK